VLAFGVKSTRQIGTVKFLQTISHCIYIPAIAFIRDVPDPGTRIRYPVKYRHPAVSVCRFCVLRNCGTGTITGNAEKIFNEVNCSLL
jgi:hypothetical protein